MRKLSRREFIQVSALATVGAVVVACTKTEQATATPKASEDKPTATPVPVKETSKNEAPAMAELVKAGKLPEVSERLPTTPFVVGPGVLVVEEDLDWEVGSYDGGILRTVTTNPTWSYPCQHALENIINTPKHHTGPM